jgi:hypothetical protein
MQVGRSGTSKDLSVAPAVGALRAGRHASPPVPGPARTAGAAGPGDRTALAERGGERFDVGREPYRTVPAAEPKAAAHLRWQLRVAPSTVQRALRRAGLVNVTTPYRVWTV